MDETITTPPSDGGRITDEVRRDIDACTQSGEMFDTVFIVKSALLCDLDRIDEEHKKAMDNSYRDGYQEGKRDGDDEWYEEHEAYLEEHGWYQALDADKQPIHLGDEMYQVKGGWVYTVESITFRHDNTTATFSCKHGYGCDNTHNVHHYHAPTVEDLLRQFLGECEHAQMLGYTDMPQDIFDTYTAKLQLRGDAE